MFESVEMMMSLTAELSQRFVFSFFFMRFFIVILISVFLKVAKLQSMNAILERVSQEFPDMQSFIKPVLITLQSRLIVDPTDRM